MYPERVTLSVQQMESQACGKDIGSGSCNSEACQFRICAFVQVRLLQHEGDLVCGMDFHVDVREGFDRHWRNIPAAEIMPYGPHGPQLGVRARFFRLPTPR